MTAVVTLLRIVMALTLAAVVAIVVLSVMGIVALDVTGASPVVVRWGGPDAHRALRQAFVEPMQSVKPWVILVPVMLLAAAGGAMILRAFAEEKRQRTDVDELRLVQELYSSMGDLERRVESLEAILLDRIKER